MKVGANPIPAITEGYSNWQETGFENQRRLGDGLWGFKSLNLRQFRTKDMVHQYLIQIHKKDPLECLVLKKGDEFQPAERVLLFTTLVGKCFPVNNLKFRKKLEDFHVTDCLCVYGFIKRYYSDSINALYIDMWSPIDIQFCE